MQKEQPQTLRVRPRAKIERSTVSRIPLAHTASEEALQSDRDYGSVRRPRLIGVASRLMWYCHGRGLALREAWRSLGHRDFDGIVRLSHLMAVVQRLHPNPH